MEARAKSKPCGPSQVKTSLKSSASHLRTKDETRSPSGSLASREVQRTRLRAMASTLLVMASNLRAMATNSDGHGLQPTSEGAEVKTSHVQSAKTSKAAKEEKS